MCITSSGRARSLNIKLLPTHLLKQPTQQQPSRQSTSSDASRNINNPYLSTLPPLLKPIPIQAVSGDQVVSSSGNGVSSQAVVQHDYHDHSADPVVDPTCIKHKAKGGVVVPFPVKLHSMLDAIERDGYASIVSWQPHGRCFVVHKPKEFVDHIMPKYFKQSKMASFQRQLNLYGFSRLTSGLDKGGYYHELFLRGKVSLAYDIHRTRVKGTGVRMPTNPELEPDLYALPPIPVEGGMPAAAPSNQEIKKSDSRRETESPSRTKRMAAAVVASDFATPDTTSSSSTDLDDDLVFFEGCPFHYLEPEALPPAPRSVVMPPLPPLPEPETKPSLAFARFPSTVSESSSSDNEGILPAFSMENMDWEGPLNSIDTSFDLKTKQPSNEQDIADFFKGFEMHVKEYHEEIERMSESDDIAFGYLLERAISEE